MVCGEKKQWFVGKRNGNIVLTGYFTCLTEVLLGGVHPVNFGQYRNMPCLRMQRDAAPCRNSMLICLKLSFLHYDNVK